MVCTHKHLVWLKKYLVIHFKWIIVSSSCFFYDVVLFYTASFCWNFWIDFVPQTSASCFFVLFFVAKRSYKQSPLKSYRRAFVEEAPWTCTLGKFSLQFTNVKMLYSWETMQNIFFVFSCFPGENWSHKPSTYKWLWREKKNVTETSWCDSAVFWLVWQSKGMWKLLSQVSRVGLGHTFLMYELISLLIMKWKRPNFSPWASTWRWWQRNTAV